MGDRGVVFVIPSFRILAVTTAGCDKLTEVAPCSKPKRKTKQTVGGQIAFYFAT